MSKPIMTDSQALSKINTKRMIEELFDRLDDHLYAPEPRKDNMLSSLPDYVQKQNLYMILRDIVDNDK
jgi:hypothetical protein